MFERERCEVIFYRLGLTNKQENTGIHKKKSKIQSAPIRLKFGKGMFLDMPDTMVAPI